MKVKKCNFKTGKVAISVFPDGQIILVNLEERCSYKVCKVKKYKPKLPNGKHFRKFKKAEIKTIKMEYIKEKGDKQSWKMKSTNKCHCGI